MRTSRIHSLLAAALCSISLGALAVAPHPETGRAMVSADHILASRAGAEVLARGGNAIDAAVATALAAGVVQPAGSGLGGGGFAVWTDGAQRGSLDFREVAPQAASRDMYRLADGSVHATASAKGGLAVGVPGEGRGLARLLAERGTLSPKIVAGPAIALAKGFPIGAHLRAALERTRDEEVQILFGVRAGVPRPGETIAQAALARTLKSWAATSGESLYTGSGAAQIASAAQRTGGILTVEDLAAYSPVERTVLQGRYAGEDVLCMSPPSSGGIALLQLLGVVEGYDLAALGHNSSAYLHVLAEAMKHVYADRAHFLGDPDFVEVPTARLLSETRIGEIRAAFDPDRTFDQAYYGALIAPPTDGGTQHISVLDADGLAVALTTTINTSFGSGVVVAERGIVLNNEMDDFAAAPGVPNRYGLVGNEANAVAPGKRPLSSMTPTILLGADGRPTMVVGASGGSQIISSVLQVVLNQRVFGMDAQEAVAAPRIHHQWAPDELVVEPGIPVDVLDGLRARGHEVAVRGHYSSVQVVTRVDDGLEGGADPRKGGWPAGVW